LINALPGSNSVNTVHYTTVEEAVLLYCPCQATVRMGLSMTSC
jgi:hypothetical protein